jgi:class 3 adenylate cyclase/pimeloyl-ACP methyl ester carboxylesterase
VEPTTGYATLGEDRIAYQVIGDGPIDVVIVFGFFGSFDIEWEEPAHRLFMQQLAEFARVIRFDQRGVGASDPVPLDALPPWEALAEEIEAVMDAVGSDEAVIFAGGPASQAVLLFAATRPERTRALILTMAGVRYLEDDDYPVGQTPEALAATMESFERGWGTGDTFDLMFPSRAGDERLRAWFAKFQRSITSPRAISKFQEASALADARSLLPAISAPTLVFHPVRNPFLPQPIARYLADNIVGARFVELDTADVVPYWDHPEVALGIIEEFATGVRSTGSARRQMAAVLFTDIVGSTALAEELGDRRWRTLLDLHDGLAAAVVPDNSGRLIRSTGDGVLATFEGPGRAIRAAGELRSELAAVDVEIRAGIHVGEVEVRGDGVDGVAVHLAARIMDQAGAGQTWASSTVRDLVFGSDIAFDDRGTHALKGFEGEWHLYEVIAAS